MIMLVLISFSNNAVKERMVDQTINQIGLNSSQPKIFSSVHEIHYKSAFKMFLDYPIFGIGPKVFRHLCSEDQYLLYEDQFNENSCSTHPHNTYIQLLSETGLIGIIPILLLFLFITYQLIRQFYSSIFIKKEFIDDYQVCLYICVFVTLWPLSPSGSFFNNYLSIIYYLPVGFLINTYKFTNLEIRK